MSKTTAFAALCASVCLATGALAEPIPVNTDNFVRAESDLYFAGMIAKYGLGVLSHERAMAPLDQQTVIRLNRDTLYSAALIDLDAGPVTMTLPDPGTRFMSTQIIDEDHYTHFVHYGAGSFTLTREQIGTRYVLIGVRTLTNPEDPQDLAKVHALQDQMSLSQPGGPGAFDVPQWDQDSQNVTRKALLELSAQLPDTRRMFGTRAEVDPIRHLIGSAMAWGGNPEKTALYLNRTAPKNDGKTIYRVKLDKVPVQGFWSISIYNAEGYYTPNPFNAYTLNNLTAKPAADGSLTVQFGGCDGKVENCLPTPEGWNWMVRLYQPEEKVLDGSWVFPELEEVK